MRRTAVLLLAFTFFPGAPAASQVHVTYVGDAYAVTFVSDAAEPPLVEHSAGPPVRAVRVESDDGDTDVTYRALLPAQALRYTVEGRSFELRAPPARDATTRIAFLADVGVDGAAPDVLDAVARASPDLVVIGGDLAYADGDPRVWNEWFELLEPLAARIPVMPAYGNHEDYCERGDNKLVHCGPGPNGWHAHFALPGGDRLYYAFDWGSARFTVLDTEAYVAGEPTTNASEQEAFLDASLEASNDTWDVVVFHRPLRSSTARENTVHDDAADALLPLLDGRADLVLQGHLHAYERAHARNGTHYLTSGGGGRELYDQWGPREPWVASRAAEHHFLLLEAGPGTLHVRALRTDGSVLDELTLERPVPRTPPTATQENTPPAAIGEREVALPAAAPLAALALAAARRAFRP